MRGRSLIVPILLFPILNWWITPPQPTVIQVAASGNVRDVLTEIARYVETRNPMTKVKLFFGTSEEVVRQIESHAAFDVYIGDEADLDALNEKSMLVDEPHAPLFMNQVVAVAPADTDWEVTDVKQVTPDNARKIALMKDTTEWGKATRAYLQKTGVLDALKDKIEDVKTPKAAIEALKRGDAKWTIAFATDAARRKNLKILWHVPVTDLPAEVFSVARLKCSRDPAIGTRVLNGLQSSIARKMFENAGFQLLTPPPDNRMPNKN